MEKTLRVTYFEQVSSHDGYCSDAENEYASRQLEAYFQVPSSLKDHDIGPVDSDVYNNIEFKFDEPKDWNVGESCYCYPSEESKLNNLDIHDFRQTIKNVDIVLRKVNNKKK